MSQKGQKVLKVHVPKNMYYTLLQTKILQESSNVNLMVAMEHSVVQTPEEFITTIFTNNCSLESTKPRTVDLPTRKVELYANLNHPLCLKHQLNVLSPIQVKLQV